MNWSRRQKSSGSPLNKGKAVIIMGRYEVLHTTRHGNTVVSALGYFGANDDPDAAAVRISRQAGGRVVRVSWVGY